ncbi:hypothetical protein JCM8097_002328 [Rhodosporidiobolus ruineniae]
MSAVAFSHRSPSLNASASSLAGTNPLFALHHTKTSTHASSSLRRDSSGSTSSTSDDSDEGSYPRGSLTSPDLSSLTPSASVPSSPKRAPGLSPSSSPAAYGSLSAPASPSLLDGCFSLPAPAARSSSSATSTAVASDDEESDAPVTPLPGRLPRPKTKADRDRERALNLSSHTPGTKREGLGVKLARKRADSFKWAKYANVGTFEVELGLSNDELRRA